MVWGSGVQGESFLCVLCQAPFSLALGVPNSATIQRHFSTLFINVNVSASIVFRDGKWMGPGCFGRDPPKS